ncbi:hypothetical protein BDQ12DRAFT_646659 [Crucibulum laeve]|uniref:Uncharacterized protein n=1 Tax=Crucibulum laeve TaxID=68775 RepID=A0A5C3M6C0_9AGAR|nr:hypothetical protein BDQ12DRAFT_646659 [Crucibulum laeve]
MLSTSPSSPPESGFTPRKEFLREQAVLLNSFALLAISGSSCIRLYSFPLSVVTTLRRSFERRNLILAFREDVTQNLCEFSLDGKPWTSPKATSTEKLLIDIITVIYHCGYSYLSTIDYGRENDDRLAMAFSTPAAPQPSGSRSGSPLPPSGSPFLNASRSSLHEKARSKRVPFALSFVSATVMRVIAPPLHLTPAILQAVRGSWPRGVVSEKKAGENCFEFKLKGYKWFQQDNFATDSLRHILTLLSSLDSHSFTLLTSISLTNRSRVKDLWVFTGPAPPSTEESSHQDNLERSILDSSPDFKRKVLSPDASGYPMQPAPYPSSSHRRLVTDPIALTATSPLHPRAATDDGAYRLQNAHDGAPRSPTSPIGNGSHLLRKPAPRAQVPVSVVQEDAQEQEGFRTHLPSTISSGVENMTGIGAHSPDVFYSTSPYEIVNSGKQSSIQPALISVSPRAHTTAPGSPLRPVSERAKTPPLLVSNSPRPSPRRTPPTERSPDLVSEPIIEKEREATTGSPPLLGAGAFRDSAFSSNSDMSTEIPIKWTGIAKTLTEQELKPEQEQELRSKMPHSTRMSSTPMLPGGWQPTPIEEKTEEEASPDESAARQKEDVHTPVHEVGSRVESPDFREPDVSLRKSEAALVGMITSTSTPPSTQGIPQRPVGPRKESQTSVGGGQGWVLVNVEGPTSPSPTAGPGVQNTTLGTPVISKSPEPISPAVVKGGDLRTTMSNEASTSSPAAKAIVIIDAMEAKDKRTNSRKDPTDGSVKGVRRFFSLSRKNSKKTLNPDSRPHENGKNRTIPRSGIRDKLRLIGTPEASRKEDKRRSID